ncbi:FtsW/RodA/SpoVE family cell cycle protein [Ligilactobacillus animalis]|uniref:FtsW/RodA/SpoVE family cell cycle protein n=1 Tax=Ligilactobacillus animalis TaxID=1605 RepID=UPI0002193F78|nr:FtsW/RodA/SpoVE family cell cycle protein [Ligilactobacillus animalis]
MKTKFLNKLKYFDYGLFIPFLILALIGIVMVYSASSINLSYLTGKTMQYFIRQSIYVILGIGLTVLFAQTNPRWWRNPRMLLYGWGFLMLLLGYAKFFTSAINGANGWINLKVISIQPSEICKLYLVMFLANLFANYTTKGKNVFYKRMMRKRVTKELLMLLMVLSMLLLIALAPDFGGFGISFAIVVVMYLAYADINYKKSTWIIILGTAFLGIGTYLLQFTTALNNTSLGYIRQRFLAVFDPFQYANSSGKQLVNSFYAVSNGGLIGRGLGESIQKRGYLPEPYTDFILSVIAEELGVLGAVVVLCLLAWIILRIFLIGIRSKSVYAMYFCYGVGTFIAVETFFNVGGAIGLLPITGVTLPFISYGGSSMIVLTVALGMVMNISATQKRGLEVEVFGK